MIQLKNLKLIGLFSLLVSLNSYSLDSNKQTQITQMLAAFLDVSKDQSKGFEQWIDELKTLIQQEPEFATFFPVLNTIRNQKNPNLVKLEILKNRGKAPQFVQNILSAKPVAELATILTARVKTRSA